MDIKKKLLKFEYQGYKNKAHNKLVLRTKDGKIYRGLIASVGKDVIVFRDIVEKETFLAIEDVDDVTKVRRFV